MTDTPPPSRRARILSAVVCGVLWAGALTATHVPAPDVPVVIPASDAVLHCMGYFVLAVAFGVTLRLHGVSARRVAIIVPLVMAAYGAFDESTQPLFNREASWGDWFADLAGAVLGTVACGAFFHMRGRITSHTDGD